MKLPHVVLFEPEIPPNTGNVARLCAATGVELHLVGRLGFSLDDRQLARAGLDYWPSVKLRLHVDLPSCLATIPESRVICFSTKGAKNYDLIEYREGDCLLFGPESRGLPDEILARHGETVAKIPMPACAVRSLNLSSSVAIGLYEALRQLKAWQA